MDHGRARMVAIVLPLMAVVTAAPAVAQTRFVFAHESPYATMDPHDAFDVGRVNPYDGLSRRLDNPAVLHPYGAKLHDGAEITADHVLSDRGVLNTSRDPRRVRKPFADLVVRNAVVYTVDPSNPIAEAVAIQDGLILFVGDNARAATLIGAETEVIDAEGAVVFPGFVDAHSHPLFLGEVFGVGLAALEAANFSDFKKAIREFARDHPRLPFIRVLPWRYDFLDGRLPSAVDVDAMFLDVPELQGRPLLMQTETGEEYLLNSAALRELQARNPRAFRRALPEGPPGNPTGVLGHGPGFDVTDFWRLSEIPDARKNMTEAFLAVIALASASGVTMIDDQGATSGLKPVALPDHFGNIELALGARAAGQLNNIHLRATLHIHEDDFTDGNNADALAIELADWIKRGREESDKHFFFGRSIKLYIDGVHERGTSALFDPFTNTCMPHVPTPEPLGRVEWGTDKNDPTRSPNFTAAVTRLDGMGLQTDTHATGDRGIRIVINGYEAAQKQNGRRDRRQRIEHNELVRLDAVAGEGPDVNRMARLGIIGMHQAAAVISTETTDCMLGEARNARFSPWRAMLDAGAPMAFSSDFSVTPISPFFQFFTAVTRLSHRPGIVVGPDQRITLDEAIRAYTLGSAAAMFQDQNAGSLTRGKFGDLVIVDPDLFTLAGHSLRFADDITSISDYADPRVLRLMTPVRTTVVGGRIVYQRPPPDVRGDAVAAARETSVALDPRRASARRASWASPAPCRASWLAAGRRWCAR